MEALLDKNSCNAVVDFPRFPALADEVSPKFGARRRLSRGRRKYQSCWEVASFHVCGVAAEVGLHILSLGSGPIVGRKSVVLGK